MDFKKFLFKETDASSDINISPLLDMVFILLIFFVVTTTFTRETGVDVTKPKAATAVKLKDKTVKVAITREGTIHIHEKQVDLTALAAVLKREHNRQPGLKVVILADENALTGRLVKVIDKCHLAGFQNVSIAALQDR